MAVVVQEPSSMVVQPVDQVCVWLGVFEEVGDLESVDETEGLAEAEGVADDVGLAATKGAARIKAKATAKKKDITETRISDLSGSTFTFG